MEIPHVERINLYKPNRGGFGSIDMCPGQFSTLGAFEGNHISKATLHPAIENPLQAIGTQVSESIDWMCPSVINTTIIQDQPDKIHGTSANDDIIGNFWSDSIYGYSGDDTINGLGGHDFIKGQEGNDLLNGEDGDDSLVGGEGGDSLIGGNGFDLLNGKDGDDSLVGGESGDSLIGGNGVDLLDGGKGDDSLSGGEGDDSLIGGEGNDILIGGIGDNLYRGGKGRDVFKIAASGANSIKDFNTSEGDKISLNTDNVKNIVNLEGNILIDYNENGLLTVYGSTLSDVLSNMELV